MSREPIQMIRVGHGLVPLDDEGRERIRDIEHGKPLSVEARQSRNYKRLKRAFKLIELTFGYWQPEDAISIQERHTVTKLGRFLTARGLDGNAVQAMCDEFLAELNASRDLTEAEKSRTEFRDYVTVKAGHYHVVLTPAGPKRVAKSWSYAATSEDEFRELYRDLSRVCWDLALSRTFATEAEAEQAVNQMMAFM